MYVHVHKIRIINNYFKLYKQMRATFIKMIKRKSEREGERFVVCFFLLSVSCVIFLVKCIELMLFMYLYDMVLQICEFTVVMLVFYTFP